MLSPTNTDRKPRRAIQIGVAALLTVLAVLGLIYVKNTPQGNVQVSRTSGSSPMRGFLRHDKPQEISDIAFVDGDGKQLSLKDWQGRVVLLNIWATWCPPCRAEMPTLNNLQKEMGGEKFEVVALSIDKGGPQVPAQFLKKHGFSELKVYNDSKIKVRRALRLAGYPTTILINSSGMEVGRLAGPAEWDSEGAKTLVREALASDNNQN